MRSKVITKSKPERKLLRALKKSGGRNSAGRITIRHRGGGSRRLYRVVDFGQEHIGVKGKIVAIEYDPNRNAFIGLVEYENGKKGYVVAPSEVGVGEEILCDEKVLVKTGNRMKLKNIPVGTTVYNMELEPGKGGKIVRAAGTSAQVAAHEGKYTHVILPSSEVRKILSECFASIGSVSNPEHRYERIRKAGRNRWKGRRPHVRGVAMNPVDHPHGGGEGRSGIGMKHPKTPWGKPALGVKTRKKKWTDKLIIKRRKKKKRKK